ncbi:methyltransferase [Amycolatopsis keratiniphila]|uniref:methyltransferase n=1 Tax=Amycolatopsis keratiniphila TaxID=129921 RepID=UPI00087B538E|nr:methyltransferase [Amycolatopsis keratiniphila]OLZ57526.1 methyltransferase [Amycolatopsis keratiniphila subsp. nogabecina]SDU68126.1 O-methyltransferase [Amycolatopsis keratiniphila]
MTTHDKDRQEFLQLAGLATPMALRVAVTLGLPDRLSGDGAAAGDLAAELGQSPLALDLLLGHLTTLGVLERTSTGYRTTEYGTKLRADAGNGLAGLLDINAAGGRGELAFVELAHSIATGEPGYVRRYGKDFWTDLAENPHLRETFDRQMTQRYLTQVPRFVTGFDWSRFGTLVDVGGGHGSLLAAILKANPSMRGHLVDLAPTAAAAEAELREQGLGDRVEVSAGSFFDPLPAGADAYLLSDILHDWDDEHAHRILARCAEAAGAGSRVLVIEAVGGLGAQTEWDLVMLVLYGGRERRLDELRELAAAHGLVFDSITTLTEQRSLLEFHREDIP